MRKQFNTQAGSFRVNPEGGAYGGGIISGVSIATRGEAAGHGVYVDSVFLKQTVLAVNSAAGGVPSALDHSDSVSALLGRVRSGRLSPDERQALGDLHLFRNAAARDLLLEVAVSDPASVGLSVRFEMDKPVPASQIRDPENVKSLDHVRLSKLEGVDVVARPAANAGGLFRSAAVASYSRPTARESAAGIAKVEARAQRLANAMQGEQADFEDELVEQWELAGGDPVAFASVAHRVAQLVPEYSKTAGDAVGALTAHARAVYSRHEREQSARLARQRSGNGW